MLRVPETKKFENNCSTGRDNQERKRKKRNKKIKRDKEEIKNWRGTEIDAWRHRNIKRRKRRPGHAGSDTGQQGVHLGKWVREGSHPGCGTAAARWLPHPGQRPAAW